MNQSIAFLSNEPRILRKAFIGRKTIQLSCAHIHPHVLDVEHPPTPTSHLSCSRPSSSTPSTSAQVSNELSIQIVIDTLSRMDTRLETIDTRFNRLHHIDAHLDCNNTCLDSLDTLVQRIKDRLDTRIESMDARVSGLYTHLDRIHARFDSQD